MNFFSDLIRSLFHQHHRRPYTEFVSHRYNGDPEATSRGCFLATVRKNSRSSPSWRIADQDAWMSLLLSRSSPVRVIDPDQFSPRWSARWEPNPKKPASWRMFLSSRQSPMRAKSWLAVSSRCREALSDT